MRGAADSSLDAAEKGLSGRAVMYPGALDCRQPLFMLALWYQPYDERLSDNIAIVFKASILSASQLADGKRRCKVTRD